MVEVKDSDETITQLTRPSSDANSLKVRLDTDDQLEKYEMYLRGEKIEYRVVNGQIMAMVVKFGKPKASAPGLQSIMSWISGLLNKHTMQGNFLIDKKGFSTGYDNFVFWFRKDFGDYLNLNIYNFGIDERELMGMTDEACLMVIAMMSRAIGNKERESLSHFTKSETSMLRNEKKFPFFKS